MMFISYWEINPDFDPAELAEIAQELISKKKRIKLKILMIR